MEGVLVVLLACNSCSVVGSLFVIWSYLSLKSLQRIPFNMVFFMAVADLLHGVSIFLSQVHSTVVCTIAGALMNTFCQSSYLWSTAVCFFVFTVIASDPLDGVRIDMRKYHVVCFGIPFACTCVPLALGEFRFLDSSRWCWIGADSYSRLFCFFVPSTTATLLSIALLVRTWIVMRRAEDAAKAELLDNTPSRSDGGGSDAGGGGGGGDQSPYYLHGSNASADVVFHRRARRAVERLQLFVYAFLFIRFWSAAHRLSEYLTHDYGRVGFLGWAHAVAAGLQGFLNALVFLSNTRLKTKLKGGFDPHRSDSGQRGIVDYT